MNGRIYVAFAHIYEKQNMVDDALEAYQEALDVFIDINNTLKSSDILTMMGFLYLKKEKIEKSKKCYKRSKNILKRIKTHKIPIEKLKEKIEQHN